MTDKEIGVIIKPIFAKTVTSKFFAYEYGIECYKKGMEYQGIKELTIENENLIKQVKQLEAQLTTKIINCIKSHLCKQDEEYDEPIISPKFLSDTLDQMTIDGFEGEIK